MAQNPFIFLSGSFCLMRLIWKQRLNREGHDLKKAARLKVRDVKDSLEPSDSKSGCLQVPSIYPNDWNGKQQTKPIELDICVRQLDRC